MVTILIKKLIKNRSLELWEYKELLSQYTPEYAKEIAVLAENERKKVYGNSVYVRGLIEISNFCKNDCLYCGIRKSNLNCSRYRLKKDDILNCVDTGYIAGFRTFVMQGGEDMYFTDEVIGDIIKEIKRRYPECAVTLSLGERSYDSYKYLFDAGADRYLLRHETADSEHYAKLHPEDMSFESRIDCLKNLRDIGYQVGCGFMVGSPYQTLDTLAKDLKFIEEFSPDMCGIGPFIPHCDTPFGKFSSGNADFTCFLLSIIRLIKPNILLPSTTALGTIEEGGRLKGILAGANVIMPNLSPTQVRKKYEIYNNKLSDGAEAAEGLKKLESELNSIGYQIEYIRGDIKK